MIATDGFFQAVPSRDYAAAVTAITSLETFDKVELLGGRVLSGDLLELRVGQNRYQLKLISSGSEVNVLCSRNKIVLFFSALLGSSPLISLSHPLNTVAISPRDRVLFHPAGQPKPEEIEIGRIVRMVRG